jgi:hypothetical protein
LITYQPGIPPNDPAQLPQYLRAEFLKMQQAASAAQPFMRLQVLHAAPKKVEPAMVVYADGVSWKPDGTNGEGLYRRNKLNSAWVHLG